MLHEFVTANHDAIVTRAREVVGNRPWPGVSIDALEHGTPFFLRQLAETLRLQQTATPFPDREIGTAAARHGADLLGMGFNVSQVVHLYGDVCQAVTQLAMEQHAPVTVLEFKTLNRCLDTAIAEAVTEHARLTASNRSNEEVERQGHAAHDLRDQLTTALLAFQMLKRGDVPVNGSTGAVLGRSLATLRDLISNALSQVRLAAGATQRERLAVHTLMEDVAAGSALHAEYHHVHFNMDHVDPGIFVSGDAQLLSSALMNLVHNAFKYTPRGGHVTLRASVADGRLSVDVEDECGGIPSTTGDPFEPFGDRRGADRSGLGLGLSIARKAVRAHGGDIRIRDKPGFGCIFTIEMPLESDAALPAGAV